MVVQIKALTKHLKIMKLAIGMPSLAEVLLLYGEGLRRPQIP